MDAVEDALRRAGDELGAAISLADAYPLQAMELLSASVCTALRAACLREFDFERGTGFGQMIGMVPEGVFVRTSPGAIAAVNRSCEAWIERCGKGGDFRVALEADIGTAAAFINDVEDWSKLSAHLDAVA